MDNRHRGEIAEVDWGSAALGEIPTWPRSLKALVSAVLACPTSMFLAWGPELRSFFNDAYLPILRRRVSGAIGKPFGELWHDIWDAISPLVALTLSGEGIDMVDTRLDIRRAGFPDENWRTFSYLPVWDDSDAIAGLLCVNRETTERVLEEQAGGNAAERLRIALSAGYSIG